jgi:predicted O-methyltransferase YrrM
VYKNICGTRFGNFQGKFVYVRANSRHTGILQRICNYDVIFVDGEHNREAVLNDMAIANACLNNNGVILVHDLDLDSSSVRDGYFEYLKAHREYKHFEIPGSLFQLGLEMVWK